MDVNIIKGEIFHDHRGKIASINNFSFKEVKRAYFITHTETSVIRGWNGHKLEKKWFYCVKGEFNIALVAIDNWENPSRNLKPKFYNLSDSKSEIISIPSGYASCIKAKNPDSILMVLSDKTMQETIELNDSYRYETDYFFNWSEL